MDGIISSTTEAGARMWMSSQKKTRREPPERCCSDPSIRSSIGIFARDKNSVWGMVSSMKK